MPEGVEREMRILTLGKEGGGFDNFRDCRGTRLRKTNVVLCAERVGEDRHGGKETTQNAQVAGAKRLSHGKERRTGTGRGQTGTADVSHWSPTGEWWCHRFQKVSPSSE